MTVYISPLAAPIFAYFGMFFALLFIVNFIFSVRSLLIEHDRGKYYSETTIPPFASLVILPIIGIAIIIGEFVAADALDLPIWYVFLAMVICGGLLIFARWFFGGYLGTNKKVTVRKGESLEEVDTYPKYVHSFCMRELYGTIKQQAEEKFGEVSETYSMDLLGRPSGNTPDDYYNDALVLLFNGHHYSAELVAFERAQKAAEYGGRDHLYLVALMHGAGKGTYEDTDECLRYMNSAAAGGHLPAFDFISDCRHYYRAETEKVIGPE